MELVSTEEETAERRVATNEMVVKEILFGLSFYEGVHMAGCCCDLHGGLTCCPVHG